MILEVRIAKELPAHFSEVRIVKELGGLHSTVEGQKRKSSGSFFGRRARRGCGKSGDDLNRHTRGNIAREYCSAKYFAGNGKNCWVSGGRNALKRKPLREDAYRALRGG